MRGGWLMVSDSITKDDNKVSDEIIGITMIMVNSCGGDGGSELGW